MYSFDDGENQTDIVINVDLRWNDIVMFDVCSVGFECSDQMPTIVIIGRLLNIDFRRFRIV